MYVPIINWSQLTNGSKIKRKDSDEYFELGEFSENDIAFFSYPFGKTGSFSKDDDIALGASKETLEADYLIEE